MKSLCILGVGLQPIRASHVFAGSLKCKAACVPIGPSAELQGAFAPRVEHNLCVYILQGLEAARVLVARLAGVPPPGCDFYLAALELEEGLLGEGFLSVAAPSGRIPAASGQHSMHLSGKARAAQQARVRLLYEAAVGDYGGQSEALWLAYARFEKRAGRGAGDIFWRAHKALADPEPFVEKFREAFGH